MGVNPQRLKVRMTGYSPHQPHPRQHAFLLLDSWPEVFYGGAGGGGKSDALLMAALQYVDVPGYAALLLRKTFADLREPGALMDRAREWLLPTDAKWSSQAKQWTFPSGARLQFGFLQYSKDREKYRSAEFQFCGFDELTQFAENDYRFLYSRMRKPSACQTPGHPQDPIVVEGALVCAECGAPAPALSAVPLRMRSASNPGGFGHVWVRERFIKKVKSDTDDELSTDPAHRIFIPAKISDNPSIHQESYRAQLLHLDPQTRQQILDGDWDAREPGSVFKEFIWDRHTVEGSRSIDSHLPVYHAIDFGLHHAPCLWIEVSGNTAFVFAEHDERESNTHAMGDAIMEIDREFDVVGCEGYIDPAGLSTNYQTGQTDAEVLMEHGIEVTNLDGTERYSPPTRISLIKHLLKKDRLFISRDCEYLIAALEGAQWKTDGLGNPSNTYRKDGLFEHPLDALGEALIRIFRPFSVAATQTQTPPMNLY